LPARAYIHKKKKQRDEETKKAKKKLSKTAPLFQGERPLPREGFQIPVPATTLPVTKPQPGKRKTAHEAAQRRQPIPGKKKKKGGKRAPTTNKSLNTKAKGLKRPDVRVSPPGAVRRENPGALLWEINEQTITKDGVQIT